MFLSINHGIIGFIEVKNIIKRNFKLKSKKNLRVIFSSGFYCVFYVSSFVSS